MVVVAFSVLMAVVGAKESPIANRAAIRVLKKHMVKEPIFEAASSRSEELLSAAMGATRDLSLRSDFVHGNALLGTPLFPVGFGFDILSTASLHLCRERSTAIVGGASLSNSRTKQVWQTGVEMARVGTQPLGRDCEVGPAAV